MKDDPISQQVLAVGLTPLIPFPIVDSMVRKRFLKDIYARIAREAGHPLDDEALELLTEFRGSRLLGCLIGAIWWPIRKLFRTFLYFLTIKECIDWTSEGVLRAEMVRAAVGKGLLPTHAKEVRDAMDSAVRGYSGSPAWRVITRRSAPPVHLHRNDPVAQMVAKVASYGGFAVAMEAFRTTLDGMAEKQLPAPQELAAPVAPEAEAVEPEKGEE